MMQCPPQDPALFPSLANKAVVRVMSQYNPTKKVLGLLRDKRENMLKKLQSLEHIEQWDPREENYILRVLDQAM